MIKNAVDVVFGGLSYWICGYGFSFGDGEYSNAFIGWGHFCVTSDEDKLGVVYSKFFFQASFATTATTIVSGAMAERTKLVSYMVFSMVNTALFSIPAHWVWSSKGWLYTMGVVDIAGAGPVHLVGGVTGLVATLLLKPRHGRYDSGKSRTPQMSSPTNAVLGMFMLWWGWLGFNCGSTFGISGVKWKLAARSAATTLCASVAGGVTGFMLSYIVKDRRFDVTYIINGLLGSLVAVTAVCAVVQPWEGLVIGLLGSLVSNGGVALLDKLKIDDPVGCVGTHAVSGIWGILAAGLFLRKDETLNAKYLSRASPGLFYGGGFHQLGIQALALVAITAWTVIVSFISLQLIEKTLGLRVSLEEEIIGADIIEHGIGEYCYDRKTKKLYSTNDGSMDSFRALVCGRNTSSNNCNGLVNNHSNNSLNGYGRSSIRLNGNANAEDIFVQQHLQESNILGHHSTRRKTRHQINTELRKRRAETITGGRCESCSRSERSKFQCFKVFIPDCLLQKRGVSATKNCSSKTQNGQIEGQSCEVYSNGLEYNSSSITTSSDRVPCSCFTYNTLNDTDAVGRRLDGSPNVETIAVDINSDLNIARHPEATFYLDNGSTDRDEITYF